MNEEDIRRLDKASQVIRASDMRLAVLRKYYEEKILEFLKQHGFEMPEGYELKLVPNDVKEELK